MTKHRRPPFLPVTSVPHHTSPNFRRKKALFRLHRRRCSRARSHCRRETCHCKRETSHCSRARCHCSDKTCHCRRESCHCSRETSHCTDKSCHCTGESCHCRRERCHCRRARSDCGVVRRHCQGERCRCGRERGCQRVRRRLRGAKKCFGRAQGGDIVARYRARVVVANSSSLDSLTCPVGRLTPHALSRYEASHVHARLHPQKENQHERR
jgi:hypothetical protein